MTSITPTSKPATDKPLSVAIIGGGAAGSTIAIRLAMAGVNTYLFEKSPTLISGPPMCHLHAGGNLYREIPEDDCKTLMRQCIDIVKLYPDSIDVRPTVISVPKRDDGTAAELIPRLEHLTDYYRTLVAADPTNQVLGEPDQYYQLYTREALDKLAQLPQVAAPTTLDEWMIPVAKFVNLDKLDMPLIAVQEYGWNIFRLSASAELQLAAQPNAQVFLDTQVLDLKRQGQGWKLTYQPSTSQANSSEGTPKTITVDYVVNATGFRTGIMDDNAGILINRMVEFKASYVSHWQPSNAPTNAQMPEIVFHGERGTPRGMAQFTPYPAGYVQLHGMTEDITLFKDGLTHSTPQSAQPALNPEYTSYIDHGWNPAKLATRTQKAIDYVAQFIPKFVQATPQAVALYGAQQVPSDDITLRVGELQSERGKRYAVAENVKANSTLDLADTLIAELIAQQLLAEKHRPQPQWCTLSTYEVNSRAEAIAQSRGFPIEMAHVNHPLQLPKSIL